MKFITGACFLLASTQLASAAAINEIQPSSDNLKKVEVYVDKEANSLSSRDTCLRKGNVIVRIGTSAAVLAFTHLGIGLARDVCEGEGKPDCTRYVGYVEKGMNLIFLAIAYASGSAGASDTNTQSSFQPGAARRDVSSSEFWGGFDQTLKNDGWVFDSIDDIDLSNLKLDKRASDPNLVHRSIVRNLVHNSQGDVSDVAFNYFDNGDLNLQLAGDYGSLPSGEAQNTTLHRRFDGAGFKISATTRLSSRLTRAHENYMAQRIAQDWAGNADSSAMSDYIGLVETGHSANFYFRIIPETKGFGLNYESVNVCGQLAEFL